MAKNSRRFTILVPDPTGVLCMSRRIIPDVRFGSKADMCSAQADVR
jgi:hypothetical protein